MADTYRAIVTIPDPCGTTQAVGGEWVYEPETGTIRTGPRLADDFVEINARCDELRRERDQALSPAPAADGIQIVWGDPSDAPAPGHPEAFLAGHADAELLHALFDDPEKAAAHAAAAGPALPPRCYWGDVELILGPGGWLASHTRAGYSLGPFEELRTALVAAKFLAALSRR